jgi:methylmalonyl-CoA epimerase
MTIKRIDHIAIVVPKLEEALSFYHETLGLSVTRIERVEEQEVTVAFLPTENSEIELLEPTNTTSGVARFLEKHGAGIHHICLEVDDIEKALSDLKTHGIQLINDEPLSGSDGKRIAFIHPKSAFGVLVELYELPSPLLPIVPAVEQLRERLRVERLALFAGVRAFLQALGTAHPVPYKKPAGINGNGIKIKAEGEILENGES